MSPKKTLSMWSALKQAALLPKTNDVSFTVRTSRPHNGNPPGEYTLTFDVARVKRSKLRGTKDNTKFRLYGAPRSSNAVSSTVDDEGICAEFTTQDDKLQLPYFDSDVNDFVYWVLPVVAAYGLYGPRRFLTK